MIAPADLAALGFYVLCWVFYEPVLRRLRGPAGSLNSDMARVRVAWMLAMSRREGRFMDGQLLGHALNSASFFASSNLLLIAAVAGVLFGGEDSFRSVSSLALIQTSGRLLFETQLALILITLSRGLLDFIWSIRQMNYTLTIFGAAPDPASEQGRPAPDPAVVDAIGQAGARVLNGALSAFNTGVRGYYFALAAAAWMFGPVAFAIATLGAVLLLAWRQTGSPAANAIRDLRKALDNAVGGRLPVGHLRRVLGLQRGEANPFGALHVGSRDGASGLGQGLEGDIAGLEGEAVIVRPIDAEHPAADLVDLVVTPEDVHGHARQGAGRLVELLRAHASTPTPIGQVTPVPPMPQ
jgi:uncharacterized membrane protein